MRKVDYSIYLHLSSDEYLYILGDKTSMYKHHFL